MASQKISIAIMAQRIDARRLRALILNMFGMSSLMRGLAAIASEIQALGMSVFRAIAGKIRLQSALAAVALTVWADISSVKGEAIITGTPDKVRVEANDTTLEQLLSELRDKFGFAYRSTTPLDQVVEGTYAGSLVSVLKRLLVRYDFVLKSEFDSANDVLVLAVIYGSDSSAQPNSSNSPPALAQRGTGDSVGVKAGDQKSSPAPIVHKPTNVATLLTTRVKPFMPVRPDTLTPAQSPVPRDSSSQSSSGLPRNRPWLRP